ncbi:cold shock domain-containing protein [Weissella ceti]|uniref:Cold shock domain-containing protein n=1 Tax=Weissella ceti TaxID=759620 RepID=A0ABT3E2L1_9LACO|nr:cold shock domain-containing protein [Weissella ceti]MCW0952631.1 cold shock domain-containing protein [Weissella ceti]QVK12336.1 cold-shock protein [Weissella ceti]
MEKVLGTVKSWDKGFGFIEIKGEPDVFVHYSQIETQNVRRLNEGQKVALMVVQGLRGPQATGVEVIKEG